MNRTQRKAVARAVKALDDAIVIYASEMCDPKSVYRTMRRTWRSGGTIGYFTDIREELEKAFKT